MNIPKISRRLEVAASFAHRGGTIADIGTDHAYLPIYLYTAGVSLGGVVSDINQGPVKRAIANLRAYDADGAFAAQRADGLCGVLDYEPDDIFILGMGGELISRIIEEEPRVKDARYRLILQPMTHPELLRRHLLQGGFAIIGERLVSEDKIYQIVCAEYAGTAQSYNDLELYFGKHNLENRSEELSELMKRTRYVLSERIKGKNISGVDCTHEHRMIEEIDGFLAEEK